MGKTFIITYNVMHGDVKKTDRAIVMAKDEAGAIKNITAYLNNRSNMITNFEIIHIREWRGLVFTRQFGQDD